MLTKTLAAAAALSLLVAGGEALAAQKTSTMMAGPKQPIPYDQLDAYLKASAKTRASKDWWVGQATTGMSTDTAATAPATASDPATMAPSIPDTAVNPTPSAAPPSLPVTPPINATPQTGDPTLPNQPVPGAPGVPPTEPK